LYCESCNDVNHVTEINNVNYGNYAGQINPIFPIAIGVECATNGEFAGAIAEGIDIGWGVKAQTRKAPAAYGAARRGRMRDNEPSGARVKLR
jgi:hypothetical protein